MPNVETKDRHFRLGCFYARHITHGQGDHILIWNYTRTGPYRSLSLRRNSGGFTLHKWRSHRG